MKNLVPCFGKRDVTSFMDLTYMDYLLIKKKVNLPRVIIRHMAYVINVRNHELPYGELLTGIFEAFNVPLNHKKGKYPKRYYYFEETFLNMSQLKREDGVWWLGLGANRRRDDDEAPAENVENVEMNEGDAVQQDFDWVQVEEAPDVVVPAAPEVSVVLTTPAVQQTMKRTSTRVDPSGPSGSIPDFDLLHLQVEFDRAF
ncbi:hypothetical protein Dimus_035899 [Dionaea muscipula]